jgi:hypothetical protein
LKAGLKSFPYHLIVIFMAVSHYCALAQITDKKPLKGIVTDSENDEYLVGVHIFARVAHEGTISDHKGKFQMMVHPEDTIIITFVGYERQVIPMAYFREQNIDLLIRMDPQVIELPGITITGEQDISYLYRKGQNPLKIHSYKPPADHPDLDVPAGSLDYGPLSRWGKEAKEKRKLLKVYQETGKDRIYIQTVSSDSVRSVFTYMYGINENEYNDFIIFLNAYNPLMDRRNPKDIVRVMHETFLKFKPKRE